VAATVATAVLEDFLVAGLQAMGLTSRSTMAKTTCWVTTTSTPRKRQRIDENAASFHLARCCRSFVYPSFIGSAKVIEEIKTLPELIRVIIEHTLL